MGEWWSTECTRQACESSRKEFLDGTNGSAAFKRKLQANHVLFPIFSTAGSKNPKIRASFFGHISQNSKLSEANFLQHRSRGHLPTSSCRKQLLSDPRLPPTPTAAGS